MLKLGLLNDVSFLQSLGLEVGATGQSKNSQRGGQQLEVLLVGHEKSDQQARAMQCTKNGNFGS